MPGLRSPRARGPKEYAFWVVVTTLRVCFASKSGSIVRRMLLYRKCSLMSRWRFLVRQSKLDWPASDWTLAEELYQDHPLPIAFQGITSSDACILWLPFLHYSWNSWPNALVDVFPQSRRSSSHRELTGALSMLALLGTEDKTSWSYHLPGQRYY
jgi:hypothetical protein